MARLDHTDREFKLSHIFSLLFQLLGPERHFYVLAMVYGVGISLLTLATPISVQMLINTVANTGLATPLIVLSCTLFVLLLASGLLNALRLHLMEIFARRFYTRLVSEIAVRAVFARNPFFNDDGRGPLFNRYFDIIIVQKMIPALFIGGFTLILQAGVGFILVSFYHPLFLAMNAVLIALLWATWLFWGRGAVRSAVELSHKKHEMAAWLESLAASNGFFKSKRHIEHAFNTTDDYTRSYIDAHKSHFRQFFAQTISLLVIYAGASAVLLGLGGWLVIQGQLTLGQLVASELVLSAVFLGLSQLGAYLVYFYDLCAAIEELSLFRDVDLEEPSGKSEFEIEDSSLAFHGVAARARNEDALFEFTIPGGATVMAAAASHGPQRLMIHLLKRTEEPKNGIITLGGADIREAEISILHQKLIVLDRPTVLEMSIRQFLDLSCRNVRSSRMLEVIRLVGLEERLTRFENGLDTKIAANGWPLSITETMLLKLAAAILSEPRVLVLNQLFDLVEEATMIRVLSSLREDPDLTVIYFTRRRRDIGCDAFLYMRHREQSMPPNFAAFIDAAYGSRDKDSAPRRDEAASIALIRGGEG